MGSPCNERLNTSPEFPNGVNQDETEAQVRATIATFTLLYETYNSSGEPYSEETFMEILNTGLLDETARAQNQAFYNVTAEAYAETRAWIGDTGNAIRNNLHTRLIPYLKPNDQVLVIGAGTGRDVFELHEIPDLKLNVYGIDKSESMIKAGLSRLEIPDVEEKIKVGAADAIPFPDDFFDVIYVDSAGEHMDAKELERVFCEMRRVLKEPNGRQANLLFNVRTLFASEYVGRAVRLYDQVNGHDSMPKVFSSFSQEQINQFYSEQGVQVVEQWWATGGTPNMKAFMPWIDSILLLK